MEATAKTVEAETSSSLFFIELIRLAAVSFNPGRTSQKRSVLAVHKMITYRNKMTNCWGFYEEEILLNFTKINYYHDKFQETIFTKTNNAELILYLVKIMLAFKISNVFSYLLDMLPLVVAWNHIVRSVSLVRSDEVRIVNGRPWLQRFHVGAQLHLLGYSGYFIIGFIRKINLNQLMQIFFKNSPSSFQSIYWPVSYSLKLGPFPLNQPNWRKRCPIRRRWCHLVEPWVEYCGMVCAHQSHLVLYPGT